MQNRVEKISRYLLSLGFIPNKVGYKYLVDIIRLGMEGTKIEPLTNRGYVMLSERHDKTSITIEKDIQNAIASAWLKGDVELLNYEFGSTIDMRKGKPSNKHFILTAIERLRYQEE